MSVYQPGIPTGTVPLNIDYQNIKNNFTQLDSSFDIDHVTFSNQSPQNGYHKSIHLNPVSTTATNPPNNQPLSHVSVPPSLPTLTPNYGQLFSAQINDNNSVDTALFFLTGNDLNLQLTSNFLPSSTSNGYTFLAGGVILQWGTASSTGSTTPISFPKVFPNNVFTVTTSRGQPSGSGTSYGSINITNSGFNFTADSSSVGVSLRWMAIGN